MATFSGKLVEDENPASEKVFKGRKAEDESNALLGTARSFTEGLTLGWGDEAGVALAASLAALQDPNKTFDTIYEDMRSAYTREQEHFREEHPYLSTGSEVVGGVASGVAGGSALAGNNALRAIPAILRYPAAGGVSGAVAGSGFADEKDRAEGAYKGAAIGGAAGAALPLAGRVLKPAVQRIWGQVAPGVSKKAAVKEVAEAFDADEMDVPAIRRRLSRMGGDQLDDAQKSPVSLVDAGGYNTLGAARSAQSIPGKGKNRIRASLEGRDRGQISRLSRKLDETIDSSGTFKSNAEELEEALRTKAKPFYDEAYSQEVSEETFDALIEDPIIESVYKRMWTKPENIRALQGYTPKSVKALDLLKRNLDDAWQKANRAGAKNKAREILDAKKQLTKMADDASPAYAKARSIYGGDASKREAMDMGRRVLNDPDSVTEDVIKGLDEGERAFFRIGAKDAILEKMEQAGYTHDVVKRILNSPKLRKRVRLAFPTDKKFREFQREALRESRKRLTKDYVLGGSPTQRIKAEQSASAASSLAPDIMEAAATGYPTNVLRGLARQITSPDMAVDPRQAEHVARMLMSRDPAVQQEALKLIGRVQKRGLLGGAPALGTGIGAIGAPAAGGGMLAP